MNDAASVGFFKQMTYAVTDTWEITKRNVRRNFRLPQLLVFSSIQPVMFLLLFNFVFGGAVTQGSGDTYINFLLPGILIQTALFGAIQTGVGLAEDMQKGVVDRFRSLPMSRVAHMAGRVTADALRNLIVLGLMTFVGVLLGFDFQNGLILAITGYFLAIFFGFAFSWVASLFGLITKDSETAQVLGFLWTFPLVFASSVFVPPASMPGWLQVFANNQPVTHAVNALRSLTQGGDMDAVWKTLLWVSAILIIFVPVSVKRYRNTS
ncbi:MAG: ABC transporter permease [Gammaproteobacteria bacterium]|nr:ABC transporter permease [Gammaproteobacteria bacterium]